MNVLLVSSVTRKRLFLNHAKIRLKGQQHMRWSREGLESILQLRAAINSKGAWVTKRRTAVLNAA